MNVPGEKGYRAALLIALAVSVAIVLGCRRPSMCSSNSDCPRGETCIEAKNCGHGLLAGNVCARVCKSKADCLEGQECMRWLDHGPVDAPICEPWRLDDGGVPAYSIGRPVPK